MSRLKKQKQYNLKTLRIKQIDENTFCGKEDESAVVFCSCYPKRLKKCEHAMIWLTMEFVGENKNSFTKNHAQLIKKFIDELPPQIKNIYICTDRGESRAPAIMAAIMLYFGRGDKKVWCNFHYHPDAVVYKTLCKTFGVFMPEILIKYKKYLSRKSLKKKISKGRGNT